jgi:hypothetical protein
VERPGGFAARRLRDAHQALRHIGQALQPVRDRRVDAQPALGARRFARGGHELEHAQRDERGVGRERAAQRGARLDARGEQPAGELARRVLARDVVVEIGEQGLVLRVELRREREQHEVALGVRQGQGACEHRPGGAVRRGGARGRSRRELGRPMPRADQLVHRAVADVEAAELVERELVARAQPQDLAMQEKVEPRQLRVERGARGARIREFRRAEPQRRVHGESCANSSSTAAPGSAMRPLFAPASTSRMSSGARPRRATQRSPRRSTVAGSASTLRRR